MRKIKPGLSEEEQRRMDELKVLCPRCGEYEWPMNDENTMTQGDPMCACYQGSGNLDIFYPDKFIQSEELQILDKSKHGVTLFQFMYTPVLEGTVTGRIEWVFNDFTYAGFTFTVDTKGNVHCKRMGVKDKKEMTLEELAESECTLDFYYDEVYDSKLNYQTGVLEIHWHSSEHPNKVTVSYEYNKEGP